MKKLLLLFAFLTLSVGLWAIDNVAYIDADGNSLTANNVTEITTSTTTLSGWCVVNGNVTTGSLTCSGAVHLILADGAKLTAKGETYQAGIQVSGDGNSLTIYGQTAQSGQLEATGGQFTAGIGGANGGDGSNITINGGIVTATGGDGAAGIGGGYQGAGSNITINDGIVIATGGDHAAGIGGGGDGNGSDITINGGIVTATSGFNVAGIGILNVAGIGGGEYGSGTNIKVDSLLQVKAATTAKHSDDIIVEHTSTKDIANDLKGKRYVSIGSRDVLLNIAYIDENGAEKTVNAWEVVGPINPYHPVTWGTVGETTWYVVTGKDVSLDGGAYCQGDVRLILADGAKLMAEGGFGAASIQVSGEGNSFTVYAQSTAPTTMGQLMAIGGEHAAGIGGGRESDGSDITINGGWIIATGGELAAGIGGGLNGSGSDITINGGEVIATGGKGGAGIGGGTSGSGSNITINGGSVTANGGESAAGIGRGKEGESTNIKVATDLIVKAGGFVNPTEAITNGGGDLAESLTDKQYVTIGTPSAIIGVTYIDENGISKTVNANIVITVNPDNFDDILVEGPKPIIWGEEGETTWYVVIGTDVKLTNYAICQGHVNLILADRTKLTADGVVGAGIEVSGEGNSLTIYGQNAQSGQLETTGGNCAAGIGGGESGSGSNITINGGKITATGGDMAAGIGGGTSGSGFNITINGGMITATGGEHGAGIGGGENGSSSNITINGGIVTANGGVSAAGIGGGNVGNGSGITISSGTVIANAGENAAAIGGGDRGMGNGITINGGVVTANGGEFGVGIGGRYMGSGSDIFVASILVVKAGNNNPPTTVIENTGSDLAGILAGKRYVTVTDDVCNLTANQDPDHIKNYYSTFYSSKKAYKVPEGVTAYTGAVDGNVLKLTSITDGIIPAGEAVILRLTTAEDNTAATKQQFALTATTTTATKSNDNALTGTDVATTLKANQYALSYGENGVGFYLWENKPIGAHKAYLTLPSGAKALVFDFDEGTTTGIKNHQPSTLNPQPSLYNLNGVRVNDNYKGIVIKNGKKVYQR